MSKSTKKKPGPAPSTASRAGEFKSRPLRWRDPLFPACNGEPWSGEVTLGPVDRIKQEFLEAYFQINRAYARLVQLRKRGEGVVLKTAERRILQKIERALVCREKLEDQHAARGIFATAVYRDGLVVDLRFGTPPGGRTSGPMFISSATVVLNLCPPTAPRVWRCKS